VEKVLERRQGETSKSPGCGVAIKKKKKKKIDVSRWGKGRCGMASFHGGGGQKKKKKNRHFKACPFREKLKEDRNLECVQNYSSM